MAGTTVNLGEMAATSRRLARHLLTIGGNRLELLTLEMQEERERLVQALLLALGMAVLGLLAALTLTAAIVVALWAYSPVVVLLILTSLYSGAGAYMGWRLTAMLRSWQSLPATLDQLRKDRECLGRVLA